MNSIPNTSQYSNFIYYNEIFVPITNEMVEGIKPYYTISNYGRVYSSYSDTFIIPHENENGYLQVSLMTETGRVFRKVHRLVMMAFGPKPGPGQTQVNHMYGNKLDNYFANLEWSTPKENVNHAIQYGLRESFAGNNNPNSSISENDARKIYDLLIQGYSDKYISDVLNINESIIKLIANGTTWNYLFTDKELELMKRTRKGHYISIDQKHSICLFYQNNCNNYPDKYGKVTNIAKDALKSIGIEINDRNIRIAKRLYYRYDNPEITSLYIY